MIQESLTRIEELVSPEHAWVVTGRGTIILVQKHLPMVPASQILGEPMERSTAAAIGWAAATIERKDHEAVMMVLTVVILSPRLINSAWIYG